MTPDLLELRLDKRRHMHRLHLGEIHDSVLGAEAGELPHQTRIAFLLPRFRNARQAALRFATRHDNFR